MSDLETRACNRCGATASQIRLGALVSEPEGWTYAVVGGLPVTNLRLCPSCAREARALLHAPPVSASDREAALDALTEAAFARGCDEGHADGRVEGQRVPVDLEAAS